MTKKELQIAAIIAGSGLLLWWLCRPQEKTVKPNVVGATGDVILGTPTVSGPSAIQGGTDYGTKPCRSDGLIGCYIGVDAVSSA